MPPAGTPGPPPARVRVTSSRRGGTVPARRRVAVDLDEQTGLGDVYLEGLMRAQWRLALTVAGIAAVGLIGLPVLFLSAPATRALSVFGLPFPWIILGGAVFPALWALARWYTRQSERIESDFAEAVNRE